MFLHFAMGNWFQSSLSFLSVLLIKRHIRYKMFKIPHYFISQFFKLFYSSRWTLGSFVECMCFFSNCVSISILCLCLNNIYNLVCPYYFYIHCVSLILLCPCFYSVFVHVTFFIHFVCLILLCPCFYVAFLLNNQCFYSISAFS